MNKMSTAEEVEQFLQSAEDNGDEILPADSPLDLAYGFCNYTTGTFAYVKISQASKFIADFKNEMLYNIRKRDAEQRLKNAYKNAINADVDVRMTADWFGDYERY